MDGHLNQKMKCENPDSEIALDQKQIKRLKIQPRIALINLNITLPKRFIDTPFFANIGMLQLAGILQMSYKAITVFDSFSQADSMVGETGDSVTFGTKKHFSDIINPAEFDVFIIQNSPFLRLFLARINNDFQKLLEDIKRLKKDAIIILADNYLGGSHHVSYDKAEILERYQLIDHITSAESDAEVLRILEKIEGGDEVDSMIGGTRSIPGFDQYPFPYYNERALDNYSRFLEQIYLKGYSHYFRTDGPAIPFFTSRGCVYHCAFCTSGIAQFRQHSIDYVKKHLVLLKRFGIKRIIIMDELANPNEKRLEELLAALNEQGFAYEFPNGLKLGAISERALDMMKGKISLLSVSVESASEKIQQAMNKHVDLSVAQDLAKKCLDRGIPLGVHIIVGYPGETVRDLNLSLEFVRGLSEQYGATPLIQYFSPIPGSPVYKSLMDNQTADTKKETMEQYMDRFMAPGPFSEIPPGTIESMISRFNKRTPQSEKEKIILNTTYKCNNNCVFCAVAGWRTREPDITKQKATITKAYEAGVRMIDFDGGEPTLCAALPSLITHAKRLGYREITLITNGRMLSQKENAKRLARAGTNGFVISLHGPEKVHDLITRSPGSFRQTIKGISAITAIRDAVMRFGGEAPRLRVAITITKENIIHLEECLCLIRGLGVAGVNIQFLTPFGNASKELLPQDKMILQILEDVFRSYGKDMKISLINIPPCKAPGMEDLLFDDYMKQSRIMSFIGSEEENLAGFLSKKRRKDEECDDCQFSVGCKGKWVF